MPAETSAVSPSSLAKEDGTVKNNGSGNSNMDETSNTSVDLCNPETNIQSGVEHSKLKLRESATQFLRKLETLQNNSLAAPIIQSSPCETEEETLGYRCKCNFQIVMQKDADSMESINGDTDGSAETTTGRLSYQYAVRSNGKPCLLPKNSFLIATLRIQTAMDQLMEHLNTNTTTDTKDGDTTNTDFIGQHLTSCTFSSSWSDNSHSDCVLTMHYDHPLEERNWRKKAQALCQKLKLRKLNGRSKGILLSVNGNETSDNKEATLRDTIFLLHSKADNEEKEPKAATWEVLLKNPQNTSLAIPVYYEKPETAFYHPNPRAMTRALSWMLNRMTSIGGNKQQNKQLRVLELYCGCGAHTVALAKSGLVSEILAVELDPRLVKACETNLDNNQIQDMVQIQRKDAGTWAKEESRKRRSRVKAHKGGNEDDYFDVLLVDPPRQGLDEEVCRMATMSIDGDISDGKDSANRNISKEQSCFRNLLYVSCGHKALLRDLERLLPFYEVVHCAQIDLFPRTYSIETLVHMRRR